MTAAGWLTHSAWQAEQSRQRAFLDSEIRNALWRLDSFVAPLLAIEIHRPSLLSTFEQTPRLSSTLINGYITREASGKWTLRNTEGALSQEPLSIHSPLMKADWNELLSPNLPGPIPHLNLSTFPSIPDPQLAELIRWPELSTPSQALPIRAGAGQNLARTDRPGQEIQIRNQLLQQFQQNAATSQQVTRPTESRTSIRYQPLQPLWVGNELVLARMTSSSKRTDSKLIELCWLNWPAWEKLLMSQISGGAIPLRLLPIDPIRRTDGNQDHFEWEMVSLPLHLTPDRDFTSQEWPISLILVWALLAGVAVASGGLLRQTLSLSERRAAFVSAVTHELRTPLTTFRLYTEMLSEGLTTDPDQQQTYFQTLHREANRLSHLVENVLAYARLENGRSTARNETLTINEVLSRCQPRLEQRVAETSLQLLFLCSKSCLTTSLTTNALAIEQILFNLIDNTCKYAFDAVDKRIICDIQLERGFVKISVSDFGPGLSAAARKSLFRAFQKSSRQAAESAPGVGLGLALSHRLARELGGSLDYQTGATMGASFLLRLPLSP